MTTFYLVRHGEVPSNVLNKHIGQREEDLTEKGRQQARDLAELLRNEPLDAIYHSPLRRAEQTAREIAEYHINTPRIPDERLMELLLGIFEERFIRDVIEDYNDVHRAREADKYNFIIPDGESYRNLEDRVRPAIDSIRAKYPLGNVCIVGHQGTNRAIIGVVDLKRPKKDIPYLTIPQDAYIKITETPAGVITRIVSGLGESGLSDGL